MKSSANGALAQVFHCSLLQVFPHKLLSGHSVRSRLQEHGHLGAHRLPLEKSGSCFSPLQTKTLSALPLRSRQSSQKFSYGHISSRTGAILSLEPSLDQHPSRGLSYGALLRTLSSLLSREH